MDNDTNALAPQPVDSALWTGRKPSKQYIAWTVSLDCDPETKKGTDRPTYAKGVA